MNIMFCGDSHAEDGILITTLSLHINSPALLHFDDARRGIHSF